MFSVIGSGFGAINSLIDFPLSVRQRGGRGWTLQVPAIAGSCGPERHRTHELNSAAQAMRGYESIQYEKRACTSRGSCFTSLTRNDLQSFVSSLCWSTGFYQLTTSSRITLTPEGIPKAKQQHSTARQYRVGAKHISMHANS